MQFYLFAFLKGYNMKLKLSRRKLLRSIPLLTGSAFLSHSLLNNVSATSGSSVYNNSLVTENLFNAGASLNKTLITYFQVPMQKRLRVNEKEIQGKPYSHFFNSRLDAPLEMVTSLEKGPLAKNHILPPTIEGLKVLLEDFDKYPPSGYGVVEDGPCAYAQSQHLFPGVTTDMFRWWFTWHPVESERYYLWFPHAHIHNSVADPKRLADSSLSYDKRLYGNPNHIIEYIGENYLDGIINFDAPESLGLDSELLRRNNFTFNASGIITPYDHPLTPLVMMIHLGRDTPAGMQMINRYWIGTHPSWNRFSNFPNGAKLSEEYITRAGMNAESLELFAYEMAVHDMTEFTSLGRFLPHIYKEFA